MAPVPGGMFDCTGTGPTLPTVSAADAASTGRVYLDGDPGANDLVCHRNPGEWTSHNRHISYDAVIRQHRDSYGSLKTVAERNDMIEHIIQICQDPPNNIRFVRQEDDNGQWYFLNDKEITDKVRSILKRRNRRKRPIEEATSSRVYHPALPMTLSMALRVQQDLYDHPDEFRDMWAATEGVSGPTENDVLVGRGAGFYNHFGNRLMLDLVEKYKDVYPGLTAPEKTRLARSITHAICHVRGGRFLELVVNPNGSDQWNSLSFERARQKVVQALRDKNGKWMSKEVAPTAKPHASLYQCLPTTINGMPRASHESLEDRPRNLCKRTIKVEDSSPTSTAGWGSLEAWQGPRRPKFVSPTSAADTASPEPRSCSPIFQLACGATRSNEKSLASCSLFVESTSTETLSWEDVSLLDVRLDEKEWHQRNAEVVGEQEGELSCGSEENKRIAGGSIASSLNSFLGTSSIGAWSKASLSEELVAIMGGREDDEGNECNSTEAQSSTHTVTTYSELVRMHSRRS